MAKRVPVVLNESVSKLGKNGDLVEVAPGYARNYLLPKGLASIATPGIIKQVEQRKEQERLRKLAEKQEAEDRKTADNTKQCKIQQMVMMQTPRLKSMQTKIQLHHE